MSIAPDNVQVPILNPAPTEPTATPSLKEPSNYWKLFIGSLFAPWVKQGPITFGKNDPIKALFHMVLMAVIGWMALAWMFIERYHIVDFWYGDWESRARVYAYENNGEFMLYSIVLVIALMWLLPMLTQICINWLSRRSKKLDISDAIILHAFNASAFSLFFTPIILIVSWLDPMSWHVPLSMVGQNVMFILFGCLIVYPFITAVIRSKQHFQTRWRYSLLHLWIPIALALLGILFTIF